MEKETYIDFGVAPYALADVCEALYNNGVTNAFLTLDDGDIHIRWKRDLDRKRQIYHRDCNTGCNDC